MLPVVSRHSVNFLLNEGPLISPETPFETPPGWDIRREETKVHIDKLFLNPDQLSHIAALYKNESGVTRRTFHMDATTQLIATKFLEQHRLDKAARERLESKWSVVWSISWPANKGTDSVHRVLLQCVCGYDTEARRKAQRRHSKGRLTSMNVDTPLERRTPYDYHGCLAHADVTYVHGSGEIKRVMGILEHNKECFNAVLTRLPAIPLHPHVFQIALLQLTEGASITAVQMKNVDMLLRRAYRDQISVNPLEANYRYELLTTDFASLYRKHNRQCGIDITVSPEYNLDNWLNPQHSDFKKDLHAAIFHYCARSEKNERLKVCISTEEMDNAAWVYGHNSQIILDGTFGVCSTRLLLFIVMGVDKHGRGVPLAMLLFSAPTGNRATHAGYNTQILTELLTSWNVHLSSKSGNAFSPYVAITDTDTKERAALIVVWPHIFLLLCRFHLRQCWTNKRKSLFPKLKESQDYNSAGSGFWREHIIGRIHQLENLFLLTSEHTDATTLLETEHRSLSTLAVTTPTAKKQAGAGIAYIEYLRSTWLEKSLWSSWSQFGLDQAAVRLKRPTEGAIPTTNHLESFNAVLKRKYIPQWQHSGNRLRFDIFIHHLILKILPEVFAQRRIRQHYATWVSKRFENAAGGNLLHHQTKQSRSSVSSTTHLTWFENDGARENKGFQIFASGRLCQIPAGHPYEFWATCAATTADITDPNHLRYWLTLHPSGSATCTCTDWLQKGGACKHLCALRHHVLRYKRSSGEAKIHYPYPFHFPATRLEAEQILAKNKAWYGPHYEASVTPFGNALAMSHIVNEAGTVGSGATSSPPQSMTVSSLSPEFTPTMQSALPPPPSNQSSTHPSSATALNDHTLFQHVAGDNHNLDNTEEVQSVSDNRVDVDDPVNISVAHENFLNSNAISFQVEQRLKHDLAKALPLLHGISSILESKPHVNLESEDLVEFRDLLAALGTQLTIGETNTERASTSTKGQVTSHNAHSHVTARKHLLPPSPEQKQKRKKSYGVL